MAGWQIGLVLMVAAGVAVILFGALWDRERAKRDRERLTSPPDRAIPAYAGDAPRYVTDPRPADAPSLALTDSRRAEIAALLEAASPVAAGMMAPEFVSDPSTGWAVLERPAVLVCAERVETFREIFELHQRMSARGRGLVVIAPDLADEPRETMVVNHQHRSMRLLAVRAQGPELNALTKLCGATPLSRSDLQAGWVPDDVLGSAEIWVTTSSQTWVLEGSTSPTG